MKKLLFICMAFSCSAYVNAQFNLINSAQNGATNAANNDASNAGSNTVNNGVNSIFHSKKKTSQDTTQNRGNQQSGSTTTTSSSNTSNNSSSSPSTVNYTAYANYDFVPGDTIIFTDDFTNDQDGEFPSHWNLDAGQAVLNKVGTEESFCLTDGNDALVSPRMKNPAYLTSGFTVEFNYYANGAPGLLIQFPVTDGTTPPAITFNDNGQVSSAGFSKNFSADFPGDADGFKDKWHHVAFIFKNNTVKCYIDQYRVLVMPNVNISPTSLQIGGWSFKDKPNIFNNVRIASGGNMNLIGKKFTDSKLITHGINFDVDAATIKPESMGTLNMIVKIMNNNPDVRFEIDGHTDNSGSAVHNYTLSAERADAIKKQLTSMGIDASRLTTKGLGDTKPISDNSTPEGKANNRRVEFVKI